MGFVFIVNERIPMPTAVQNSVADLTAALCQVRLPQLYNCSKQLGVQKAKEYLLCPNH